ncbi:Hypothetical predicted protein [Paramuricea clavata]|uniref:Uncharacterized protein n=1 Tax=Paramuricea clavata TaxID=317549 RepID=A0A6S7JJR0_PARCT|nr:Hypothetical predicted protein [Paramuricea clavata]
MGLHLAAVILFQYHTGCMIHVPGKCVPHIITCLADYMSPADHVKLIQYQGSVVKQLTKGGEVVEEGVQDGAKSIEVWLEEGLAEIKDIALSNKKTATSIPQLDEAESLLKNYPPPLPSIGQIKTVLNHLNHSKATGADGVLAPIIHDIITASIKQCRYPSHYKHGLVTPVPKAYPPTDVSNDFRQISVLPHIGKILERVQLQLNQNDILRPRQHGFTSGRSTTSALISITQPWFNAIYNTCRDKAGIHALFIDFKKVFDLVDHGILLNKLALMNVNKSYWLWVKSFLSGRTQQVKINQTLSSIEDCPAGVPQGS